MTSYTITGTAMLPDADTPLVGSWRIRIASGYALTDGVGFRAGEQKVVTDISGNASITLPETPTDGYYEARFVSATALQVQLPKGGGWYQFQLSADMTWDDVITAPQPVPPLTPTLVQQAEDAADDAQASATAAADSATAAASSAAGGTWRLADQTGVDPDGETSIAGTLQGLLNDAAAAGGGTVDLSRKDGAVWLIDDSVTIPQGVGMTGNSGNVYADGTVTSGVIIRCSGATARLNIASGAYGPPVEGFTLDGNEDGDPTGLLYIHSTQRSFRDITVQNPNAVAICVDAAQNNNFENVNVVGSVGRVRSGVGTVGVVFDHGAGGNLWLRSEINNADICLSVQQTAGTTAYLVPTHNDFKHCIFENSNATGTTIADIRAGLQLKFDDCLFSANNDIALSSGYVVKITNTDVSALATIPEFVSCTFVGGTNLYDAIYVGGTNELVMRGRTSVAYCSHAFATDGHSRGDISAATFALASGTTLANLFNELTGGSFATWFADRYAGVNFKLLADNPDAVIAGRSDDASQRFILNRDGTIVWTNGSNQTVGASATYDESSFSGESSVRLKNVRLDGRLANTVTSVVVGASDADVTINAQNTSLHLVALAGAGNVSSTTITNPTVGSTLTICYAQGTAGGKTYAWPADCRFAGGAGPADTTASTATSVTFLYLAGKWIEQSRAVAVPTT